MKKNIFTIFVLIVMILSMVFTTAMATAEQTEEQRAATILWKLGLFHAVGYDEHGTPDFALDFFTTRIHGLIILISFIGEEDTALNGSFDSPYLDVMPELRPYVEYAYEMNYLQGMCITRYEPDSMITAQHFLTTALGILGYENGVDFLWYKSWALSDEIELTDGKYNKNNYRLNRGEMAVLLLRMLSTKLNGSDMTLLDRLIEDGVFEENAKKGLIMDDDLLEIIKGGDKDSIRDAINNILNDKSTTDNENPVDGGNNTTGSGNNNTGSGNNSGNGNNSTGSGNNSGSGNNNTGNNGTNKDCTCSDNNSTCDKCEENDSDNECSCEKDDCNHECEKHDCTGCDCDVHDCNHECEKQECCDRECKSCKDHECYDRTNSGSCECSPCQDCKDADCNDPEGCKNPDCPDCNDVHGCDNPDCPYCNDCNNQDGCENPDCPNCNDLGTDCDNPNGCGNLDCPDCNDVHRCDDSDCPYCNDGNNSDGCENFDCPNCNNTDDTDCDNEDGCDDPDCPDCNPPIIIEPGTWPKSFLDVTDEGRETVSASIAEWIKERDSSKLPTDSNSEEIHNDAIMTTSCYMFQQTGRVWEFDTENLYKTLSFTAYNTSAYTARIQIFDYDTQYLLWSYMLNAGESIFVENINISRTLNIEFLAELVDAPSSAIHYDNAIIICDPLVDREPEPDNSYPDIEGAYSLLSETDTGLKTTSGNISRWVKVINKDEMPAGSYSEAIKTDTMYMRQATRTVYTIDNEDVYKSLSFTAYNQSPYTARIQIFDYETNEELWSATLTTGTSIEASGVDISGVNQIEISAALTNAPTAIIYYYDAVYICNPLFI